MGSKRIVFVVSIALPLFILLWSMLWVYPFIEDDSLISLRYARRLLDGHGLTWNDDERVEGYSNLLWVLLSAGLGALGLDLIVAVRVLGFASIGLSIVALAYHHRRVPALIASAYLCASGPTVLWSIGGLEQPLVVALLSFAMLGIRPLLKSKSDRGVWRAGVPLGLMCLSRPDSPIFVAAFAIVLFICRFGRDGPLRAFRAGLLLSTVPLVAWFGQLGFRLFYYGDWVPNPTYIKLTTRADRIVEGLGYLVEGLGYLWPLCFSAVLGSIVGLRARLTRAYTLLLLLSCALWIAYVVLIGGDHFPGHRHLLVVLMMAASLSALAFEWVWEQGRPKRIAVAVAAAVLLAPYVALQKQDPAFSIARAARWQWDGQVIGSLFARTFGADRPLWAVEAAGCLPYFSGLPAIDMLGLNDRYIARGRADTSMPLAHDHGDGAYVLSRKPDLITFGLPASGGSGFVAAREIKRDQQFSQEYRRVRFEGWVPQYAANDTFVRVNGRVGIQRNGDDWIYPAYLLQGEIVGQEVLSGKMGARLTANARVNSLPLSLQSGIYRIRLQPDNPLIEIGVRLETGSGFALRSSQPAVVIWHPGKMVISLVSPTLSTQLEAVIVEPAADLPDTPNWLPLKNREHRVELRRAMTVDTDSSPIMYSPFDNGLGEWIRQGDAFASQVYQSGPGQTPIFGHRNGLLNSYTPELQDRARGLLRSPVLVIPKRAYLSLRIGGGQAREYGSQVGVRLLIDGSVQQVFTGRGDERLREVRFDLSRFSSKRMQLEVFDDAQGSWGHILVDEVAVHRW